MTSAPPEHPEPTAAELAQELAAWIETVFGPLEELAAEVLATRPARGAWTADMVMPLRTHFVTQLTENHDVVGTGFVAAPHAVRGHERFIAWWQRQGEHTRQLRLNFDPASIDVYDYLQMEWFRRAQDGASRVAYGPYVDYSGSDAYTVTATVPVVEAGQFLGVVGADLDTAPMEQMLRAVLQTSPQDAVVLNDEGRIVAANTAQWVVGARLLPARPGGEPTQGSVREAAELPGGTGWTVVVGPTSPSA